MARGGACDAPEDNVSYGWNGSGIVGVGVCLGDRDGGEGGRLFGSGSGGDGAGETGKEVGGVCVRACAWCVCIGRRERIAWEGKGWDRRHCAVVS